MRSLVFLISSLALGCGGSSGTPGSDASTGDASPPIVAPPGTWTWIPIDGMTCADGSPTGIGVNLVDTSPDVMVFMAGGGACWDANTCFSLMSAVHITGGYGQTEFNSEIMGIGGAYILQRAAVNPFANASWIYVPYCTGDLHDGNNVATYGTAQVHHVGRRNTSALMERLAATRPDATMVWMLGASAGGYGVSFDWDLARLAWPQAKVHVLADSSQLVAMEPTRWSAMQASWQLSFPPTCSTCTSDLGAMTAALRDTARPGERYGLLAYTRDQTIAQYFGLTMDQLQTATLAAQAAMSPTSGQAAYVLAGSGHVLLASPTAQTSGGVVLSTWIQQWATGDAAWANAGP
ncbi:MAG TPA: pectin acetylesterase-family hydrolase [Kofleriaceae bacterium]